MADDKLKIVATVEDQFTGPLSKLQKGLAGVGDETKKHGASWKKDWAAAREEVDKFKGALGGFTPILSTIGMGSFGAALSIGGIATALKNFSGSTRDLSNMGRQIGMTVDQLRAFGALGEKFGASSQTMQNAIGTFAENMKGIKNRYGAVYDELRNMNLGSLVEELVSAPNMEAAVEILMKALQKIPDNMKAAFVASITTGSSEMATVARSISGPISDAVKGVQREIGSLDKQTEEAARHFEEHWSRIGRAVENGKLKILGPALKGIVGLIDDADKNGLSGNEDQQALRNQLSPFSGPEAAPREKLEGRRTQVQSQLDLLERGPHGADYERKHTRMVDELKRVGDELQKLREQPGGASVSPSGYTGPSSGGGSMIQKTAWGGFGSSGGGAAIPAYGSPGGSGGGSSGASDGGSSPNAPVPHASQIDRGMPDLGEGIRGRPFGSKGDGAAIPSKDAGANPGAYKAVLDHIADSEGTINRPKASGYNTSLGYGRFLPGGNEQNLTGMTLDQISALGRYMRRQPGNPNSSALGRYQIVGDTMRRLMKRMGLKGGELFDEKMQDRMAAELARDTRGNPARLRNEWASLTGERNRRAAELMGQVDRSASTMPEDAPASTAKGPLADPGGPLSPPKAEAPEAEGAPEPTDGRGVNADLIKVLKRAQALSKVKFHVHEGLRTLERQREMVRRGWSKTMDSEHLKGRAVDVRADGDPAVGALDRKKYEEINRAMRQASEEAGIPVEWGGDWKKFKDIPHFQFPKGYRAGPNAYAGDPPPGKPRADDSPAGKPTGPGGSKNGTLHIKVDGPPGTQVHHDMGDLFGDTTVSHGKSQMSMARA